MVEYHSMETCIQVMAFLNVCAQHKRAPKIKDELKTFLIIITDLF